MSIDEMEHTLELSLLSIGITNAEISGLLLIILAVMFFHVFITVAYLKVKCSGVTCSNIDKMSSRSEKISEKITSLEVMVQEMKVVDNGHHEGLKDDIAKIDVIVVDLKASISQLHGIIIGGSIPVGRRRLEDDIN